MEAQYLAAGIGLNALLLLMKKRPGLPTNIAKFDVEVVNEPQTTERRSTGEQGYDFHIYPVLTLTPDINGSFEIKWKFINTFAGTIYDSEVDKGLIHNTWAGLTAGVQKQDRLLDNTPSGVERGQGIGIGDPEFIDRAIQDGNWYSFESDVSGTVISPSGRTAQFGGTFGPEDFRSWGDLAASINSFQVDVIA